MESNSAVATPAPQWDFIVTGARLLQRLANFREIFHVHPIHALGQPGIELVNPLPLPWIFTFSSERAVRSKFSDGEFRSPPPPPPLLFRFLGSKFVMAQGNTEVSRNGWTKTLHGTGQFAFING